MPVTDITTNLEARTLTVTAQFAAPVERVWQVYADPRQFERIWGPPSHPATVVDHRLEAGGHVHYFMTAPDGQRFYGGWNVLEVEEPRRFTLEDFFADDDFRPAEGMPVATAEFTFTPTDDGSGTIAVFTTVYATAEALEQVLAMGMEQGVRESTNQIDALLAEG